MQPDTSSQSRINAEETQRNRTELDRKVFFLETLLETSRELSGLIQPKKIMDSFLLMAMGSLGTGEGLLLLLNTKGRQGSLAARGLPEAVAAKLEENLWPLFEQFYAPRAYSCLPGSPQKILHRDELPEHSLLPGQTELVLLWSIDH